MAADKAGDSAPRTSRYTAPGEGRSSSYSALSIVAIFALWWGGGPPRGGAPRGRPGLL
jgi:hypothetical protein